MIDPTSPARAPLPGYENGVELGTLLWLLARLLVALYLVASALAAYDARPLAAPWIVLRLGLAVAVLARPELIHLSALSATAALLALHHLGARRASPA